MLKEYNKDQCSYEGFAYSDGSISKIDGDENHLDFIPSTSQSKVRKIVSTNVVNETPKKKKKF